jgi:hypothetical protein
VHTSYGHLYALANNKAIGRWGEALPNTEVFRPPRSAHGIHRAVLPGLGRGHRAHGRFERDDARADGIAWDTLKSSGWQRLAVAAA